MEADFPMPDPPCIFLFKAASTIFHTRSCVPPFVFPLVFLARAGLTSADAISAPFAKRQPAAFANVQLTKPTRIIPSVQLPQSLSRQRRRRECLPAHRTSYVRYVRVKRVPSLRRCESRPVNFGWNFLLRSYRKLIFDTPAANSRTGIRLTAITVTAHCRSPTCNTNIY